MDRRITSEWSGAVSPSRSKSLFGDTSRPCLAQSVWQGGSAAPPGDAKTKAASAAYFVSIEQETARSTLARAAGVIDLAARFILHPCD